MPTSRVNTSNGCAHHGLRSTSGGRAPRGGGGNATTARALQRSSASTTLCGSTVHPVMRAKTSPLAIAPPCSKHHAARATVARACARPARWASASSSSFSGCSAACSSASLALTRAMLACAVGCSQSGKCALRPPASIAALAAASTSAGAPTATTRRSFGRLATRVRTLTGSSTWASIGSASSAATTPWRACASASKSRVLPASSRSACAVSVSSVTRDSTAWRRRIRGSAACAQRRTSAIAPASASPGARRSGASRFAGAGQYAL